MHSHHKCRHFAYSADPLSLWSRRWLEGDLGRLLWVPEAGSAGAQGLHGEAKQQWIGQHGEDKTSRAFCQVCYSSVPGNRKTPLFEEIFPLLFVTWCLFLVQEFT